jgi:hypothetical protein
MTGGGAGWTRTAGRRTNGGEPGRGGPVGRCEEPGGGSLRGGGGRRVGGREEILRPWEETVRGGGKIAPMLPQILDGQTTAAATRSQLPARAAAPEERGVTPGLGAPPAGDVPGGRWPSPDPGGLGPVTRATPLAEAVRAAGCRVVSAAA